MACIEGDFIWECQICVISIELFFCKKQNKKQKQKTQKWIKYNIQYCLFVCLFVYIGRSVGGGTHASPWTTHGPFQAFRLIPGANKVHAGLIEDAYSKTEEEN